MPAQKGTKLPPSDGPEATLESLSEAVESGAGLPAVARAAAKVLDASVALIDRSSAVLAVAAGSSGEEEKLLASDDGIETAQLRVAASVVGELRYRPRGTAPPSPAMLRMVSTLLALELERSRAPEWASDEAAGDFVRSVTDRSLTDRGDLLARGSELGADLEEGAGVLIARVLPRAAQTSDWRSRAFTLTLRAVRAVSPGSVAAESREQRPEGAEFTAIVPGDSDARLARAAEAVSRELIEGLTGFMVTIARSRHVTDVADLHRAGQEAKLAANVGEAEGHAILAFEDTGAYRLLLPAMSEDPAELERFYSETVEPLAAYDEQYETDLVNTVETYLDRDGNVAATAQVLFTHRHTVRYRLERAKELCGHDVTSTEGREKLGLGLKAMRVLGIAAPRGPATEPGTTAGKVKRSPD
jgi:DNA-binding PucR family transcriptional regulator